MTKYRIFIVCYFIKFNTNLSYLYLLIKTFDLFFCFQMDRQYEFCMKIQTEILILYHRPRG